MARMALILALTSALAHCGFRLRGSVELGFSSLRIEHPPNSVMASALQAQLDNRVKLVTDAKAHADLVLQVIEERRSIRPVSKTLSGQVREVQLIQSLRFSVRSAAGKELLAPTTVIREQEASYSESQALAKEAEQGLMFQEMQSDIAQQVLRRLGALRNVL